eukprot:s1151_g15.t1
MFADSGASSKLIFLEPQAEPQMKPCDVSCCVHRSALLRILLQTNHASCSCLVYVGVHWELRFLPVAKFLHGETAQHVSLNRWSTHQINTRLSQCKPVKPVAGSLQRTADGVSPS